MSVRASANGCVNASRCACVCAHTGLLWSKRAGCADGLLHQPTYTSKPAPINVYRLINLSMRGCT
eukprot:11205995-Alexandrium_andersonii.AAC.1